MDTKFLEIRLSSNTTSADDILHALYHASNKLPLHILYSNQNDVFYLEFPHLNDAINALRLNDSSHFSAKVIDSLDSSAGPLALIHSTQNPTPGSWSCSYCSFNNPASLSFCLRCLRPSDGAQTQATHANTAQPLNEHSASGPPVGSILNPIIVGQSEMTQPRSSTTPRSAVLSPPILSPTLPSSPLSSPNSPPLSTMSTISSSPPHTTPPQNLFDVLASLPTPSSMPNQYAPQIPSRNPAHLQNTTSPTIKTLPLTAQTAQSPQSPQEGQLPPILNTGSQGPMQMQPGDWVCTCGFVNWRRRKQCYRCHPFANGNNGELARAAQRAAQLASMPQADTGTGTGTGIGHGGDHDEHDMAFAFDAHDINISQEVLDRELNNSDIRYMSALQSQYPRPNSHPAPGTEAAYRTFLASKKAWGAHNGIDVDEYGMPPISRNTPHSSNETFEDLKDLLQRVQSRR
ncbi:hypothetical protein E3P99_01010 [Wallemia hederae]|uniref:RanBP2-type domain-containing protein n=1 Tax=Wallemia hederae TaxID=1540922 RepID=A0A4T0FU58_9BASI|nr:hypothetical protein E3P99_01010 [Wallemia hederae]